MKRSSPRPARSVKVQSGKSAGKNQRGGKASGYKSGGPVSVPASSRSATSPSKKSHRAPALPDRNQTGDPKLRWVIGLHSVRECLKIRPQFIREFWVRENFEDSKALVELTELAKKHRLEVKVKASGQIEKFGSAPQGIAVGVSYTPELDWDALKAKESAIVVILDGIEDPQNLGSILRSAWLLGVSAVIVPRDRSVQMTPTVAKVASGGAEHVPVEVVNQLAMTIAELKEAGFWIYGLAESGTRFPWDFKLGSKVAWIVGAESEGLRITTERSCDELVKIPQVATGSSFNAAVTAAMALYESVRQNPSVISELGS